MTTVGRSATSIAGLVTDREVSAEEVATDHLDEARRRSELNTFTELDADRVLTAARLVDQRLAAGESLGPLAGVPVAVKDIIDEAGVVTTCGSGFYRRRADSDATVVTRLRTAGAVPFGRTGLHEFAFGFSSENEHFGPVRNPWDPATSPGGSSGGSAAAVAAGITPIGVGTDTGGSVRAPAAMCGITGLKVTHGRIPLTGVFPLAPSLDTVGPLARSIDDLAAAYLVMAGDDPSDPWSVPRPVSAEHEPLDAADLRIGLPHPWIDRRVASEIATGFRVALDRLDDAGATIVDLDLPSLDRAAQPRAAYAEVGAVHRDWFEEDPTRYGEAIRDRLAGDLAHTADDVTAAIAWRRHMTNDLRRAFETVDVVVTPTTAALRKVIGVEEVDAGEPETYRPALSWFTTLVNQVGVPALALPLATPDSRPPPSIQIIGPSWTEHRLFTIGRLLTELGVTKVPPSPDG